MAARLYKNNFNTTTTASITNVATTIPVASTTGLTALTGGDWYILTLQSSTHIEVVKVTGYTGLNLTVVRAQEGTSGFAFPSGSIVSLRPTAASFSATGSGDVVGPASSTDNALARFDTTTGKLIQDSVVIASDTGALSGITNITLSGTVDGRDVSVDGAKLDTITGTNTGDQTITLTGDVTGTGTGSFAATIATPSSATVANDDKVIIKDTSASDATKYVTTLSIRDLTPTAGVTGTGAEVNATSPTLVTPNIGVATGTSINLGASTTINGFINDSTLGTASATTGATSSSIKTYVDARAATRTIISGTTQTAAVNTTYIALNSSQTTITLPSTYAVGDTIAVIGATANTGGWVVATASGDTIRVNNTTTSASGTVTSAAVAGQTIFLMCDVADTSWVMTSTSSTTLTTS